MLTDITLGQYLPGKSIVHRLDPRVKISLLFFYIVAVFVFDTYTSYAVLTLMALSIILLSKVPLMMILRSLRPIIFLVVFTMLFHVFATSSTLSSDEVTVLWQGGIFIITEEGIIKGLFYSLRLMLLIACSSLLMFTTPPLMLTDALEDLMGPLKKVGFPAHELAMIMTIAMRFIPTLMEEADKIMKAQQARGIDFEGNIIRRMKQLIPILVPLFVSAFRRADELAMAMEARGYHGGIGRTRMKKLQVHKRDYIAIGWFIVIIGVLCAFKYLEI